MVQSTGIRVGQSLPVKTLEQFEKWRDRNKKPYLYEFSNGIAFKKSAIKQNEFLIDQFLTRLFSQTHSCALGVALLPETDVYINSSKMRIPDLAYFTR